MLSPTMVHCGSTVNVAAAAVGSVFPAASVARTSNVCGPSVSCVVVYGDEQLWNGAASTRHARVEPDSLEANANVGVESLVTTPECGRRSKSPGWNCPDGPAVI